MKFNLKESNLMWHMSANMCQLNKMISYSQIILFNWHIPATINYSLKVLPPEG